MDFETSFGGVSSGSHFDPSSVHVNSRLILSSEDAPRSIRWQSDENIQSGKETPLCRSTGAGFSQSVPKTTRGILKNKQLYIKPVRPSRTRELWESARGYLKSDKAWLTTHSTVETQSINSDIQCSNFQTFMNLIKGSTGTGLLTLPFAFMHAGLWTGFFGFLLVSLVAVHCMHIMIISSVILEKRSRVHIQSYPQVLGQCLLYGPRRLQKYGPAFEMFGHAIIYIMQCSFCCVYIVWIAVNVKNLIDQVWLDSPDVRVYEFVIYLILLPYVMISDLRVLSMFSALANALYFVSLAIISQYLFQDPPNASNRPAFKSWANMPLFLGTSIYCFESVCLVIPLRGRMRREEDMGGWTGLLTLVQTIVVAVDTAVGFYGYLKFGEQTAPAVTLNLPEGVWLYRSVTLMFAGSVLFSLAVQFYVPVAVLCPAVDAWVVKRWPNKCVRTLVECLTRAGLLTLILLIAVLVPHIDLLVELIGSLFGCLISMIVPALVELIILYGSTEMSIWTLLKDVLIILVGILGMACGTYISIIDILDSFSDSK
ncbi:hypothetical protein EGW08_010045 [Elysia chlorotica]|uniref:Amino acid transporter transmembrane domain-containing protein n=1 Tax=Elysia chlorotica TaxID=188477 RepID=A0A3S1B872_ELYCH|nr:hypothetical protein EGW08_010045 [Elysia chlorotica]